MALSITAFTAAPEAQAAKKAKKITLNATKKTLTVGKKFTLKVKVKPAKASKSVTWKSSKASIASVSSKGVVTAKKAGKAKITAVSKTNKKAKATCTVTVKAKKTNTEASPSPADSATTAPAEQTASPAPASASPTVPGPTPTATAAPTATPLPTEDPESLKANADFDTGTVINPERIQSEGFTEMVRTQCDIVTFENQMKGYLMDTAACQEAAEKGDEVTPVCNFSQADEMMEWAIANGLRVRGHVLIWEASMRDEFFYKGYNKSNGLVDKDTLIKRMQNYTKLVVTHFESKYPGTVIAWDVVNEAINMDADADATTGLHLNTYGNFYKILGGEYIKYAFQCARDAVKASGNEKIQLFYNDYNCFQGKKTDYIEDLISYLNSDPNNKLLDCMGMEGYVLPDWPNANDIGKAMERFAAKGVKVGITELTVRLNPHTSPETKNKPDSQKRVTEKDIASHAQRCEDVYKQYCEFNKKHPGQLTNVSMWGMLDRPDLLIEKDKPEADRNYDYTIYGTNSGLFTENFEKKDSFFKVLNVLKSYKTA